MRSYFPNPDLGWVQLRLLLTHELDGREHLAWNVDDCCGIENPPVALRLIKEADQVYIFPIKNSVEPRRDDKHIRLLDQKARKELVRLLSHQSDWEPGNYALVGEPEPDIGFVFRRGKNEVVLFFSGPTTEGTINGHNTKGLLNNKRQPQFEQWKRRYAQQELPSK